MSESVQWGDIVDNDIEAGLVGYEQSGLVLQDPTDIRSLDDENLRELAKGCGELLDEVYAEQYPLSTAGTETLMQSIREENTHLFTLTFDEKIIAMTALIKHDNPIGEVKFTELGRTCSRSVNDVGDVSMRPLLKGRVPWGIENTESDFLYSTTRTAAPYDPDIPSGKGVQSVWWGSRVHGSQLPFVTTNGNWEYKLNDIEPFNSFTIPTDPDRWAEAVSARTLYLPRPQDKMMIDTLIGEGTNGVVQPNTIVVPDCEPIEDISIRQYTYPSAYNTTKYIVTNTETELNELDVAELNTQLGSSISQKLTIESDVIGTLYGARVAHTLERDGWTLAGWEPSEIEYGGIRPVFARLNPGMVDSAVQPAMYSAYFDAGGLAGTRSELERAYDDMYSTAQQKAAIIAP